MPAMVGEFHPAREQVALRRAIRAFAALSPAAWRTDDAQSIEPSASSALARDARWNVSATTTACMEVR
ncbi:hypothetical protein ABQ013_08220 [Xanthomonas citri pv. malvacearum]|uniref:Uncharacterized protein n=2 Tax=Xanthomonas TaxID=338 RepID=A0AA44Z356_XANCM|nr:hypothetical protein APY29_01480 [Xanthomonas citri pv. malvacearum]EKQ60096.1 hypothetical protein WS7_14454 [Xanthomonas citri pv. malvacearum str. GSPB2388]NMI13032.1 hypothetical protein [Xanthomonas citri]OOW59755.1 hypothetical protein Xths_04050 [Xanthomonas campestris pv. thespesiae]OOW81910.1 hypothetical protein Xlen_08650 [Xanthomonas campestris pv. leeana]OOW82591.1 hypothetical protein Xclt_12795 [Xanthomonas axonopodis pv. clitoriae]